MQSNEFFAFAGVFFFTGVAFFLEVNARRTAMMDVSAT
jgi:hypothetical protein